MTSLMHGVHKGKAQADAIEAEGGGVIRRTKSAQSETHV